MIRKINFYLAIFVFNVSFGYAGTVVKSYEFSAPVVSVHGLYSTIEFENSKLLGEPGRALIPFYPVKLLLAPGEIAGSISIAYERPVTLDGEYVLMPAQEAVPLSEGENGKWLMDKAFYAGSSPYPKKYRPHLETQFYNGSGIALSAFTPVTYIPSLKQVTYYQRVIVTVHTVPDPKIDFHGGLNFSSAEKIQWLSMLVQNPGAIADYPEIKYSRTADYDYLVITKNQFINEFDTLVSFYKPRGIRMKVTSAEYINSNCSGADLQEKIRNYIIGEYQAHGIDYVMIGGDCEVIPYRGFFCHVDSDVAYEDYGIPADLYYAALDGNWNTDGDNKWAEPDEDDLYPELGIGRLSFSDTTELHNMLHKTILYQANPVEGELTRPLLAGEYLYGDPVTYGSDYMNLLVGYRTDNGYSTHGIPPEHPRDTLYDKPGYTFTKAELIARINAGRPWVHHTGHANYTTVMRLNNSDITNSNFSGANGIAHNYTIVYTHGCICGGFDYADCIGEKMTSIDNFAVAFVGNSRYGWFNQGTTDGPSEHFHREFADAMYHDSLYHLGMTHLKSKSETAPFVELSGEFEPGATRWCFYDNNVLGDPMMALWTREPYAVTAAYPWLIPIGADSLIVHVTGPNGVCRGFTCSIFRDNTLFGVDFTDTDGIARIGIDEELLEGSAWLVVSGYNIIPQYFPLEAGDYWLGLTNDWNDPVNWYTGEVPDHSTYVIIPANPPGDEFPLKNTGVTRHCKAILIEPGALFDLGTDETFFVGAE
jgi:hypothetical protein